jgi:hypothetical protein
MLGVTGGKGLRVMETKVKVSVPGLPSWRPEHRKGFTAWDLVDSGKAWSMYDDGKRFGLRAGLKRVGGESLEVGAPRHRAMLMRVGIGKVPLRFLEVWQGCEEA